MIFRLHLNATNKYGQREIFEFGEQCNYIDYSNEKFCIFIRKDNKTKAEEVLMLVPYEHILYIEQIEED